VGGKSSLDYLSDAESLAKYKASLKKKKILSPQNEKRLNTAINSRVAQSLRTLKKRVNKGGTRSPSGKPMVAVKRRD
jgi:hypothetical protein